MPPAVRSCIVSRFRTDADVAALLLNTKSDASGLTLVEANHVVLVEPSLNPAMEQQAAHRIHRIGQLRDCTVHRLIARGTVEELVLALQRQKQQVRCCHEVCNITPSPHRRSRNRP